MGIVGWISCIRSLKAEYLADQTDNVNRLDLTMPGEETPLIPRQVRRQEGKSNLRRLIINHCHQRSNEIQMNKSPSGGNQLLLTSIATTNPTSDI